MPAQVNFCSFRKQLLTKTDVWVCVQREGTHQHQTPQGSGLKTPAREKQNDLTPLTLSIPFLVAHSPVLPTESWGGNSSRQGCRQGTGDLPESVMESLARCRCSFLSTFDLQFDESEGANNREGRLPLRCELVTPQVWM